MMQAILLIEIAIPSLKLLIESPIPKSEWAKKWYEKVIMLAERRL